MQHRMRSVDILPALSLSRASLEAGKDGDAYRVWSLSGQLASVGSCCWRPDCIAHFTG